MDLGTDVGRNAFCTDGIIQLVVVVRVELGSSKRRINTRLVIRSVAARNVMIGAVVNSWNWNTPEATSMGTRMNRTLLLAFSS